MSDITTGAYPYPAPRGITLNGWLADGSGGRKAPGVLVAHEAPGASGVWGENVRRRARLLAERGWVALALDMYGVEHDFDSCGPAHRELTDTPGLMLQRARAALSALAAHPHVDHDRMAAIGFCQGGVVAMELARDCAPIGAAIGFHPGLRRPAGSPEGGPITAKVLMLIGDDDPVAPPEHRAAFAAEMKTRQADWQLHVFGGVGHSYSEPKSTSYGIAGFGYDALADRRAWGMALSLLDEVFGET
jgi:dienelactone hydrolase